MKRERREDERLREVVKRGSANAFVKDDEMGMVGEQE